MAVVGWLRWLPARALLEPEAEQLMQAEKVRDARKSSTLLCLLAAALLLIFNLANHLTGLSFSEPENLLRYACIALLAVPLLITPRLADHALQPFWLTLALLMVLLICGVFYLVGQRLGRLGEGGPLVVVMAIGMMSFFHLGQKLLLWSLLLLGLLLFYLLSDVRLGWSLFYCVLGVSMFGVIQYRLDVLQRKHFRFELAERQKAETDKLTGALNRHAFERRLSELLLALTPGQTLGLAMLDIDHFKHYNDHYGHLQGDAGLVAASRALQGLGLDLLVRFGGEEFILVAVAEGAAPERWQHLHECVSDMQMEHSQSELGRLTASVGLCLYQYQGGALPASHQLLAAADALLYQAKEQGRNRLCSAPL